MKQSDSYNPKACCGEDCYALGVNQNEPCWGDVSVIDEVECGDGDYYFVHSCQGHLDCYDGEEYKQEIVHVQD